MSSSPVSSPQSSARLRLARLSVSTESLQAACEQATRLSARVLGVARVGIWLFENEGAELVCWHLHGGSDAGEVQRLHASDYPTYMHALLDNRWINADDARSHPLTRELAESYLVPLGIASMLDAPIFRSGELFGVVCHEHVGQPRTWSESNRAFAGSVADILALVFEQAAHLETERRRLNLEIRQHREHKLEALGRLATGVAHDVNNLLMTIEMTLGAMVRARSDEERAALAASARTVVDGGATLTRQLLAFAKQQDTSSGRIDLSSAVQDLAPLLRALVRGQVNLDVRESTEPLIVQAAPAEIQQILFNLVLNARDAMPKGGTITLAVEPGPPGGAGVLRVSDDGVGMDADVLAHLFEPFFTTKAGSGGTGVGLSTVKSLVDELHGTIDVESAPGRGTTVRVQLPVAR